MEAGTLNLTPEPEFIDARISAGTNRSLWLDSAEPLAFEKPDRDLATDVLIIGGGIAGLSVAYCLTKAGRKVILVEDGFIGSGETGRTTAHLTSALDDRYYHIEDLFDTAHAQLAAQSHQAAIEWVAKTVEVENIDCEFKRVNGYLFLHDTDKADTLEKEFAATQRVGLPTRLIDHIPGFQGEANNACIQFPEQAQFHIMKYLKGLSKAIRSGGGRIFTQAKADNISSSGVDVNGFRFVAEHIVVATNTPINNRVTMHTRQWPYRTYVIAAPVPKGKYPTALWWDTGDKHSAWVTAPYHYVRLTSFNEEHDLLICGGEDHRTGQTDQENIPETQRYTSLFQWAKKRFPDMLEPLYQWSGQVMEPVDSLAYIGRNPGDENIYIITGDSGNGITHTTLGGIIISNLIQGIDNAWSAIYDPARITLAATGDFLHETADMILQFGDYFTAGDIKTLNELQPGQGAVINSGFTKAAVYRDEHYQLHMCSAICPHLGGIVQWNAIEKSFDCPLHGSRFTADGTVINGPANCNLKKIESQANQ